MRLSRCSLFALLLFLPLILMAQTKSIRLRNELIRTPPVAPGQPAASAAGAETAPASGLFLIQFTDGVRPEWQAQLQSLGIEFVRYVPDDAFIVRLRGVPPGQVRGLPFVHWLGNYRSEHKLHASLRAAAATALPPATNISVSVLLSPRANAGERAAVRALLRTVRQESNLRLGNILRGDVAANQINALAASDAVLWIEPAPKMRLIDEESSKIVGGDDGARTTPTVTQQLGFDGRGVAVAVADSGLDTGNAATMHPDLAGRVDAFMQYGSLTDAKDEHSHGTHVAGIIAGNAAVGETDANGALYGLGVASAAHVVVQRIFDGLGNFEAPPSFGDLTHDALSAGAVVGNNSWGDDVQGRYDLSAEEYDELVRDADPSAAGDQPFILEFSAGNAGPSAQTIDSPAVAKNVIATGASQNNRADFFIYTDGQEAMADFSSRGPCEDGRLKPDVVAPGTWIASLRSQFGDDNNAWAPISDRYLYQGGTSQAGPHVAGAAAVFVQYYRQLLGVTPSPALVKAALINSAVDMLDEFGTDPVPNNDEGWGRVDLTQMIGSERSFIFVDQTNLLSTGATWETGVVVTNSTEPLKITLAWTDVPGFAGAVPALVNDLDLEVIGPDGTLYRGNRFAGGESIPNPASADAINNVEAVHLLAPRSGEYLVRVRARNVPQDARADSPAIDQDFALVASGAFLAPNQSVVFLDRDCYRAPDRMFVGVIDRDRAGVPSLTVTLSSGAEPAGEPLTLSPKNPNGVFTNSMATATGAAVSDGTLQVAHGNLIQARYNDVSAGLVRIATATADLVPPLISAVTETNRFGRALVRWNTDEPANSRVDFGTNAALGSSVAVLTLTTVHEVTLDNLVAGRTYYFRVVSADAAGNSATNDNGGLLFMLVAPSAPPVLLVDAFFDDLFYNPPPPLSGYTGPLDAIGVAYDVWDHQTAGDLTLADLHPYRVVIWRLPELNFTTYPTWTVGELAALTSYLEGGGSLFVASMDVLSRLGEAGAESFRTNTLKVNGFNEDATVPGATGVAGDPIGDGLAFTLDFLTDYGDFDISDTITPAPGAAPIFTSDLDGDYAGLRYPTTGVDSPWRLVFLSFPFDAVPEPGRTELLRRSLQFLAPGLNGEAVVTLDRSAYSLPGQIIVEVGDADVQGAGQITVTALTTTEPGGQTFTLAETARPGVFRGTIPLVSATNAPLAGRVRGAPGDQITMRYFDASQGKDVEDTATVDVTAPQITGVRSEVDYSTATIYWDTDEPADSLVEFGESLPFPINRTAFDPALTTSHGVTLAGLQPDHTYYYRVVSRDAAGNTTNDDHNGLFYSFHTLKPLTPPFIDHFETGATNWSVFSSDESEIQWTLGVPNNGVQTEAHSPSNAWGSCLNGEAVGTVDTFLISPAILLTSANEITLRFWHSYDFTELSDLDIIEGGELLLVDNDSGQAFTLATYFDSQPDWTQESIDLTPHLGRIVYLVWHHQLLSFDFLPRAGWLVDDVEITGSNMLSGTITITNNLSQATFALSGPAARSGAGFALTVTNAPPGQYVVTFGSVPYYVTPPPQTNTLGQGGTVQFAGLYTFPDANGNGISDLWEAAYGNPAGTDTDQDGMSNYAEFVAGTDPTNSASKLVLTIQSQPNRLLRLEWTTVPGRSYQVLSSTDLMSWTPLTSWTRAAGSTLSYLFSPPVPSTMYRVQVRP